VVVQFYNVYLVTSLQAQNKINLLTNNFSENHVTTSNGGMTFCWLNSCL